ncbi:beta-ketoacyl synthase N-terminal-like domain-containing protein [Spongiactinospora sp. TRM90649]|uniref:beta-ketoacyl synthase N-terminal-like domain-containing protein n=1 Tax=Spongiactinospora sp. TRM90649 TaxID=3031114 RepID=UPI0023F89D35|nr:beta-ketoacyl synthase N-terminal-like domain-containing protein [Spongiactinospora sp. TRM90649]MDF5755757.1 beta-ketoacyl synthase N-terminal-like domain-containing protein [Spongiactinospora sp. TRM90649]
MTTGPAVANVCVTGMAWTTALGDDLPGVWDRLLAGDDGFREVPSEHPVRNPLAAVLDAPPLERRPSERQRAIAADALCRALDDAASPEDPLAVLGTGFGALLDDDDGDLYAWASDVRVRAGLRRPPVAVGTACCSGADAIAVGFELVRSGAAEVCVCGAADVLTPVKRLAHTALGTMSPTRLRAFDRSADGTLLGEAAGFVVLEPEDAARARGVRPYAVLNGAGAANDGGGLTAPDPAGIGAVLAARRCLAMGGLRPGEVTVVNAHGSGTPANDHAESRALARLFAGCRPRPVAFATKGAFGHTLGASGAIEAIALILALGARTVPPVAGLAEPLGGFPVPLPTTTPLPVLPGTGLSLTLGFGGFVTGLAFTPGERRAC